MTRMYQAAAAAFFLAVSGSAAANDSSAVLGADGLRLEQSDSVALESEELYVSTEEIRVRYRFRNVSAQPVETIVAFPLPDIDLSQLAEVPVNQPSDDPVNFVDFRVAVDGVPVSPQLEQRAFRNGAEVTGLLQAYGIPLTFFDRRLYDALNALDEAARADLMQRELALYDEYWVYPLWLTRTHFHWPQIFPPGEAVVIEHSYKPVVGQSFFGEYSLGEDGEEAVHNRETFCIDAATERGLRRMVEAATTPEQPGYLLASWIKYILTTGANWAGPIGRFHLTVDKGSPSAIVSFCAAGVRKTGPTSFEVEYSDYVPERDLDILVVSPIEAEE